MTTLDDEKDDSHLNNKREDLGWEYYGRFDGSSDKLTTDSVSRSLSQPVLLSPQQRNAALSEFVAKHWMPRVYDVETYYSDGKHPYYQLCYQFLQEKYVYGEGYSLEPFKEFYEKVFSNDLLKKSFTQSVFSYLKDVGIDINQPSLPSQRKAPMLFANIKAAKFVGDSGEAGKIWLIRMLAYQFIRYLQKNPDFFRQLVVRSKTQ